MAIIDGAEWESCTFTRSFGIWQPSARMLAVRQWFAPGDGWHGEVLPVVGVRAKANQRYVREATGGDPPAPGTAHGDMLAAGWTYDSDFADHAPLVQAGQDVAEAASVLNGLAYSAWRLVTATWPASEDACRLAGVAGRLRAEVRRKWPADVPQEDDPEPTTLSRMVAAALAGPPRDEDRDPPVTGPTDGLQCHNRLDVYFREMREGKRTRDKQSEGDDFEGDPAGV